MTNNNILYILQRKGHSCCNKRLYRFIVMYILHTGYLIIRFRIWHMKLNIHLIFCHLYFILTHANGSRGGEGLHRILSSAFRNISKKTDAAGIIKLDIEMFHDEFWRPIYFEVKRSKVKVTSCTQCLRGSLHSPECWLLVVVLR